MSDHRGDFRLGTLPSFSAEQSQGNVQAAHQPCSNRQGRLTSRVARQGTRLKGTKALKRSHTILLLINLGLLVGFGGIFLTRGNTEFSIYIGVIAFFLVIVALSLKAVDYTTATLVGLTVWSAMHLAGGGIAVGDGRLYDVMLVGLTTHLPILRYDQLVHIIGFGASTLVMFCLMPMPMRSKLRGSVGLNIVLVMAGLGVGAFNEIVEFLVSLALPENGVGGYQNTALDLCADLIGAILALGYIRGRYLGKSSRDASEA